MGSSSNGSDEEVSRRLLLVTTGVAISGIAGCTEEDGDDSPSGNENQNSPTDNQGSETNVDLAIRGDVPTEIEAGEGFTFGWEIENQGDAAVEVVYGLDLSIEGDSDWEPVFEDETELEPGETKSDTSDSFSINQSNTVQWRFWIESEESEEVDELETEVVTPNREFGDSYRTPHDLVITASNLELTSRYTYEDYSGDETVHTAPEGSQFAFIDLSVENDAGETRETPNRLSFEIVAGNQQVEPMSHTEYERDDTYEGLKDIVDGVVEEGVLPYVIPDDIGKSDINLFHQGQNIDMETTWEVRWE